MSIRFLTSGESHGVSLTAIIEGIPAGLEIDFDFINNELAKRQVGYGRGGRMKIETDKAVFKSGVRLGKTTGAPICIEIINKDFENWQIPMSIEKQDLTQDIIKEAIESKKITNVRPGHADLSGAIKYNFDDVRNVLERSSARETATRVAVGAVCKLFLKQFKIECFSFVTQIGTVKAEETNTEEAKLNANSNDLRCADKNVYEKMKQEIDDAEGDSLGGSFKVICEGLPVGLGSYVHWDRRLDGKIAQAVMSIPAVKSIEIGLGKEVAESKGSLTHDEIFIDNGTIYRKTNNAGGIEGGMTNGEDIIIQASMKAIPTIKKPLKSINIANFEPIEAHFERSDTCAVPACAVVAEAMVAYVLANTFIEKFGSDNMSEIKRNYQNQTHLGAK